MALLGTSFSVEQHATLATKPVDESFNLPWFSSTM
jgi:hypothetical protein